MGFQNRIFPSDMNAKHTGATKLPNQPKMSATDLKKAFDAPSKDVIAPKFNGLIDELEASSAAIKIGAVAPQGLTGNTVQSVISGLAIRASEISSVVITKVDRSELADVAFSGSYADLSGAPILAAVATSGSYNDLSDKPTIPDELADLQDDSTHRVVTDAEKTAWSAVTNKMNDDGSNSASHVIFSESALTLGSRRQGVVGSNSFAGGTNNLAEGQYSFAFGTGCKAEGNASHAEGYNTEAYGTQFVYGQYNDKKDDTSFEIGNGYVEVDIHGQTSIVRQNAFEVYEDGSISQDNGTTKYKFTANSGVDGYYDENSTFHPFNIQSDYCQVDDTAPDYIKSKPYTPTVGKLTTTGSPVRHYQYIKVDDGTFSDPPVAEVHKIEGTDYFETSTYSDSGIYRTFSINNADISDDAFYDFGCNVYGVVPASVSFSGTGNHTINVNFKITDGVTKCRVYLK